VAARSIDSAFAVVAQAWRFRVAARPIAAVFAVVVWVRRVQGFRWGEFHETCAGGSFL
jgi:hypothetical protein